MEIRELIVKSHVWCRAVHARKKRTIGSVLFAWGQI